MVGMKPREKEEVIAAAASCVICTLSCLVSVVIEETVPKVSSITSETKQEKEQVTQEAAATRDKRAMGSNAPSLELGDLMINLKQIDKKLKCSEEDRQELKKESRPNRNENLDNCFVLARATEEKLQQMANKMETTDKEREKHIKNHMEEMKEGYNT